MSLKGFDRQMRHRSDAQEIPPKHRPPSSSRQARNAAVTAAMEKLSSESTKAEMEMLRNENRGLKLIIQQLKSLTADENLGSDIEGVDGIVKDSRQTSSRSAGSEVPPSHRISGESNVAVVRHPQTAATMTLRGEYSEEAQPLEDEVVHRTESDALEISQAILDATIANYSDQDSSSEARETESQSERTAEEAGEDNIRARSVYDVPDDFDPENEDYNLSDVETVNSDETLQAWGIEDHPSVIREASTLTAQEDDIDDAAEEGDDEDDEYSWDDPNQNSDFHTAIEPGYTSGETASVTSEEQDGTVGEPDDKEREDVVEDDDTSTILGEPHPNGLDSSSDDDKASTVAETGSYGSNDERWLALMRDLGEEFSGVDPELGEEIPVGVLELARSEAEDTERNMRFQEYHNAISETQVSEKDIKFSDEDHIPGGLSTVRSRVTVRMPKPTPPPGKYLSNQGDSLLLEVDEPPKASPTVLVTGQIKTCAQPIPAALPRAIDPRDPWLVDKFNEIWSTLSPETPENTNKSFAWINSKPTIGSRKDPITNQEDAPSTSNKPTQGMSESKRIFLSFDPTEDVIGILRPKVKGEKNTLSDTIRQVDITTQSKKTKSSKNKEKVIGEEPARPTGKIENQFRVLNEERLRRQTAETVKEADPVRNNKPSDSDSSLVETPGKRRGASRTKTSPTHRPAPLQPENNQAITPKQLKKNEKIDSPEKLAQKASPISSHIQSVGQPNVPKTMMIPLIPAKIREGSGTSENEKKILRFEELSPSSKGATKMAIQTVPILAPQTQPLVKGPQPKLLSSILKPETAFMPPARSKPYNYEYIREVSIRNLPNDITYTRLLDQVSGGLLEKVTIDWIACEARITFAEPEAARRFYSKIEKKGLWVQTELPDIRVVGTEGLIQCTLCGFLWTQHSSQMSPSMIQGIWGTRASRCLLITDFPNEVTTEKLVKDIFELFAGSSRTARDIIETAGVKRNPEVSVTGFIACVRFTAISFAVKVGRELAKKSEEYKGINALYDGDPCGGLMGTKPPNLWVPGKVSENPKPGEEQPTIPLPQKVVPAVTEPIVRKPVITRRGQLGAPRTGKGAGASGRKPIPQPPPSPSRQTKSMIAQTRSQANKFTRLAKTYSEAAKTVQNAIIQPIPQPVQRYQPLAVPMPAPNLQKGLPPQKVVIRRNYDNWDAAPEPNLPTPEGLHWNHKEQNLVIEYQQAISVKKRHKDSDPEKASTVEKKKAPKSESSYYDRLVYLTNLPQNVNFAWLLRFVRGGAVEHLILQPPSSQYDTSKAIIIFVHRHFARDYKSYLHSPGLTMQHGHRLAFMDHDAVDRRFDGIRLVPSSIVRSNNLTRCLRIDMLPKGTTLKSFLNAIEESMNHNTLDFEHASIDISPQNKNRVVIVLRLVSIGRALWVAQTLSKRYEEIDISYDRDPCSGPLTELDEVNLKG